MTESCLKVCDSLRELRMIRHLFVVIRALTVDRSFMLDAYYLRQCVFWLLFRI